MQDIVELARKMADKYRINHVVIASLGDGARRTVEVFGVDAFRIHAIANTGDIEDEGIPEKVDQLRAMGVAVHLLPNSLFQALSNGGDWTTGETTYTFAGDDFFGLTLDQIVKRAKNDPYNGVFQVLYQTLQSPFSDGPRMCIEIALMAADAKVVPTDEDIISIDRPGRKSNCPHSAMVLRPARTVDFLKHNNFRVKELVTVPGWKDKWFNDGHIWSE